MMVSTTWRYSVEDLLAHSAVQEFDIVGLAKDCNLVDDDSLEYVEEFGLYHSYRHVHPLNPQQTWIENNVDGGQIVFLRAFG